MKRFFTSIVVFMVLSLTFSNVFAEEKEKVEP